MRLGLQQKYALIILSLVIFIVVVLTGVLLLQSGAISREVSYTGSRNMEEELLDQLRKRGKLLGLFLSESFVSPLQQYDTEAIRDIAVTVKRQEDVEYIYLYDPAGKIIHDGTEKNELAGNIPDDAVSRKAVSAQRLIIQTTENTVDVACPVKVGDKLLGGTRVGLSMKGIKADIRKMKNDLNGISRQRLEMNILIIIIISGGLLVIGLLLAIVIAGRLSRPITTLSELTAQIGRGEYNVDIPIKGSDEIAELAISFKDMAGDLQKTTVSKDYVDSILRSMNDTLVIVGRDNKIKTVNFATLELLGYDEHELVGRPFDIICEEEESGSKDAHLEKVMEEGSVRNYEVNYNAKDGRKIPMLVSSAALRKKAYSGKGKADTEDSTGDKTMGVVCVAKDITEKRKTEKALKAAKEEAEIANQTKSRFLANMAHEIRTPMNAIVGFVDLLKSTPLNEQQKDYLATVASSGQALISIINDILDISKVEAGELKLEYIDFNLRPFVEDIFTLIRTRLEEKSLDLYYQIERDVPICVEGDPTRLRQILINLLSNSIKFTEKGEVGLEVTLEKSLDDGRKLLLFKVKDTGIGIPENKTGAVFQVFTQADMSTTRKYGGSGLGLSICKSYVGLMGGDIWVESEEGKGSEFIFNLPVKERPPVPVEQAYALSPEELKSKRILVVDDNDKNRRIVRLMCEEFGIVSFEAASGRDALDWLSKTVQNKEVLPDIVLVDIMMPEMDGYELTRRIKDNASYSKMKLVAASSIAHRNVAGEDQRSKFDAFLLKPITRREFISMISTVLGSEKTVEAVIDEDNAYKGIKVLVAEDNLLNQKLIKLLLNKMGCVIEVVDNGKEAVEKLEKNKYDLILMDVQMPVMDGLEASKYIRENIDKDIPIIALTASVMKEDEKRGFLAGMSDYLAKPIDVSKLKERLLKWGKGRNE